MGIMSFFSGTKTEEHFIKRQQRGKSGELFGFFKKQVIG